MENEFGWHGAPMNEEQYNTALSDLEKPLEAEKKGGNYDKINKRSTDVTVIVIGDLVSKSLKAAEELAKELPTPVEMVGIADVFGSSGDPKVLAEKYNIDETAVINAVKKVISRK